MRITHVAASDIAGGAARAAYRIHRSLVEHGAELDIDSGMRVIHRLSDDPRVEGGPPRGWGRLQGAWKRRMDPRLRKLRKRDFHTPNTVLHSIAWPDTGLGRELERSDADLLHLHWLGDTTLSIEEIGRLRRPLLWTLHDQWAFCGAEHYTSPPEAGDPARRDDRFARGYRRDNRPAHETGPDLNRRTWERKRRAWRQPISIVCPSRWLADCARRSVLMRDWPVTVIPYPLDLTRWAPVDQSQARSLLGLPQERRIVLFGAMAGTTYPHKGGDLLFAALRSLHQRINVDGTGDIELVVFGQEAPAEPPSIGFPIRWTGHLHEDISLRLYYSAADVFVIPSRQDNLPNTGLEAQACGTPVVAFRTGGLPDVVQNRVTGCLAEPFDPESLAMAMTWVLGDRQLNRKLGGAARDRAEKLWDPLSIATSYSSLYKERMDTH